jgi:hypothetical protein
VRGAASLHQRGDLHSSQPRHPAALHRQHRRIRLKAIEQRGESLAELDRLKELERVGRVLAAREERQAKIEKAEELATFRASLASKREAAE